MTRAERGGILIGWIVKLMLSFAIVGFVLFETGAVIVSKVVADRVSLDAAQEAALSYGSDGSRDKARVAAREVAEKNGATLTAFAVIDEGKRIRVTITKEATTLLVKRIGPLERWATAEATNSAPVR